MAGVQSNQRWLSLFSLVLVVPTVGFAHSGKPMWTSQTHPYTETMPVADRAGNAVFTATFHATEEAMLDELAPDLLSVTMPTAKEERVAEAIHAQRRGTPGRRRDHQLGPLQEPGGQEEQQHSGNGDVLSRPLPRLLGSRPVLECVHAMHVRLRLLSMDTY